MFPVPGQGRYELSRWPHLGGRSLAKAGTVFEEGSLDSAYSREKVQEGRGGGCHCTSFLIRLHNYS